MSGDQDITSEHPTVTLARLDGVKVVLRHAVRTDTGLVRDHNEDDFIALPDCGVYLVADGMGGHNAGSVASRLCIEAVDEYFLALGAGAFDESGDAPTDERFEDDSPTPDPHLAHAMLAANEAIFRASMSDSALTGMGTTVVGVRLVDHQLTVCHAGDSRAYLYRNGDLRRLTLDHSLGNFLRALGRDAEARLAESTMSNVIMRALGLEPHVDIETSVVDVQPGDRIMLCSDGLSDLVPEDAISRVLSDLQMKRWEATEKLVELALDQGGRDNITVMIVDAYADGFAPVDDDPANVPRIRFDAFDDE